MSQLYFLSVSLLSLLHIFYTVLVSLRPFKARNDRGSFCIYLFVCAPPNDGLLKVERYAAGHWPRLPSLYLGSVDETDSYQGQT